MTIKRIYEYAGRVAIATLSGYRNEIYKKQFPGGSWFGVKELALPELMIEIELEVYKPK